MYRRVTVAGKYKIRRPNSQFARYKMISHGRESTNSRNLKRRNLVNRWRFIAFLKNQCWMEDGLNSMNYTLIEKIDEMTHINITVDCLYDYRNSSKFQNYEL